MRLRKLLWLLFLLVLLLLVSCAEAVRPSTVPPQQLMPTPTRPSATASAVPAAVATVAPTSTPPAAAVAEQGTPDLRYLEAAIEETLSTFDGFSSYVVVDLEHGAAYRPQ